MQTAERFPSQEKYWKNPKQIKETKTQVSWEGRIYDLDHIGKIISENRKLQSHEKIKLPDKHRRGV